MSIFTGKGKEIKDQVDQRRKESEGEKLDYKKIKINKQLKAEGDSIRVRVLSKEDYTTYESHSDFEHNIYSTPCINPTGEGEDRCLMCEAYKAGYEKLKPVTRFLFAFYDIDLEMIRYIDVSYTQGLSLMDDIEENEDSLEDFAFTLKRAGSGTKTTYKLSAILGLKKKDPEAQARFEQAADQEIEENFFEKALYIKSTNQMAIDLENSGFDVEGKLGYVIQDEEKKENNNESDGDEAKEQTGETPNDEKVF
jgi:hypothetical protein